MDMFIVAFLLMLVGAAIVVIGYPKIAAEGFLGVYLVGIGLLICFAAMCKAADSGTGKILNANFQKNAIYAVLSSAPVGDGMYAVVTRLQSGDGELRASLLAKDPPKMFKATGNESDPFEPFP